MASNPALSLSFFVWISSNPYFCKISLYSAAVRSLPLVCTSMFRDCRRVLLGPRLSSLKNFSVMRRPPPEHNYMGKSFVWVENQSNNMLSAVLKCWIFVRLFALKYFLLQLTCFRWINELLDSVDNIFIIHCFHYLSSHWLRDYS